MNIAPIELTGSPCGGSHIQEDGFGSNTSILPNLLPLSEDARVAVTGEHEMTFCKGCRLYPKAIAWSGLLSMAIVLEAYGIILINGFLAFPVFRRSFGTLSGRQGYEISAAWQAGLINAAYAGEILGLAFNGPLADRFGYKLVMIGCLIVLSLLSLLTFLATNIWMLVAGYFLCGLPWGAIQTLSVTYAAEVMPVTLRAYLTSNINNCWLFGQLLGASVMRILINEQSPWSYRIPLALQWVFVVPILAGMIFAPESPWWLVRHGRSMQAENALLRLVSVERDDNVRVRNILAMLRHTYEAESHLSGGGIACMTWITQSLCGSALTGYAVYFYEQAGLSIVNSVTVGIGVFGAAIIGGMLSWVWLRILGRRTIYLYGLLLLFIVLMITGGVGTMVEDQSTSWALGSLIILLTFIYDTTIGPTCYVLVVETPSSHLRIKTVVLARIAYSISSLVVNVVTTRMLNPTAWHWGGRSSFLFAGTTICCFVWAFFRLPEPKGLTFLELDILFSRKASARKFREFRLRLEDAGYFSLSRMGDQRDNTWDPHRS
ncbi:hypothetical protein BDV37DRAFT_276707 [Aspergillus pseudonomiae]|uniref:Major facilitator superfamily (MFS) profile domain-containing protein n=1 Tax=Aspergillus pseudonomiae TaxID=1506151 RepID=A0A5N7CUC4_9EURO|nr:uncharacterized protein BDV37DRAFT_276707 [Aspergillus pseudonomiae]KAE8397724.1 hypothetical protein BDV37DRAFT_276707 [Aspergillus pseudonomiae]